MKRNLLITLLIAFSLMAQASYGSQPDGSASFQFNLESFGSEPDEEMNCLYGACEDQNIEKDIIVATYINPSDLTHFFGYEITQPSYNYYNDELYRIKFKVISGDETPDFMLNSIEQALVDVYGMSFTCEKDLDLNRNHSMHAVGYSSDSGIVAHIVWEKKGKYWSAPSIKIQKTQLIDRLNKDMNPNYVPSTRN